MKDGSGRIVRTPASLRTNSLYAVFHERQMTTITKGFMTDLSGLPVLLDNLKY